MHTCINNVVNPYRLKDGRIKRSFWCKCLTKAAFVFDAEQHLLLVSFLLAVFSNIAIIFDIHIYATGAQSVFGVMNSAQFCY